MSSIFCFHISLPIMKKKYLNVTLLHTQIQFYLKKEDTSRHSYMVISESALSIGHTVQIVKIFVTTITT